MSGPSNKAKAIAGGIAVAGASLIAFIGSWEGRSLTAYSDIVGVVTYCDGITQPPPIKGKTYTHAECNALALSNVTAHGEGLLNCVAVRLNQNQYDALVSWTFNVGVGAACGSTLVRKLNRGDYPGACNELLRWDMAGGKHVRGLTNRRKAERELCIKPMPIIERAVA
jgi:lysozyme